MKYIFLLLFSSTILSAVAQSQKRTIKKLEGRPVFFVDSVSTDSADLKKLSAQEVATVRVVKDSNAILLIGPAGKDGIVYIETKAFARKHYWSFFRSKSLEYARIVRNPQGDSTVQYILNDHVLTKNYEGDLAAIGDAQLKEIRVVDQATLKKDYAISGKKYGLVIVSEKP